MALTDCTECWSTPCECGHDYKNISQDRKDTLTKAINGYSIKDVFIWLSEKDYLSDDWKVMYQEFKNNKK
jgi:hypothetical protein